MTSTPGFEPSPHWWEESALTPSFSSWFLFVLSSVSFLLFLFCFLILQLKIVPHRSQCVLILQSLEHLHSYCRIPWFKPHANCKNRVKFTQLCCVRKGLNRRGELWRHVTMTAKFLDHNNGELKQWRLWRQRARQKSNRFTLAKQQLCTCITLFCTILSRRCKTATWNFLISLAHFMEYPAQVFLFVTYIRSFRIQRQKISQTFWQIKY